MKTSSGLIVILIFSGLLLGFLYFQEEFPEINIPFQKIDKKPVIYLSSEVLEQSDTLLIKVENMAEVEARLGSKQIGFTRIGNDWFGFVGIDVKMEPGKYYLVVGEETREIEVIRKEFPVTKLIVTEELEAKGYTPSAIIDNIINRENVMIRKVLDVYTEQAYFDKPFIYPLKSNKVVGMYGAVRKSGEYAVQHLGVDLDADMNTKVYAVNDGVVVFVRDLTNYGRTVIIDHGLGIYSLYLHLEKFNVSEGDKISQGEVIGLSGNSGYSIAPHLHFSVKLNKSSVDPLNFIEIISREMVE